MPEELRWLLCDAMTSGGLLVAVAAGLGRAGSRASGGSLEGGRAAIAVSA